MGSPTVSSKSHRVHVIGARDHTACGMAIYASPKFRRRKAVRVVSASRDNLRKVTCRNCLRILLRKRLIRAELVGGTR